MSKPLLTNEYDVEIESYTAEGKGVCRVLAYPVFVPFSAIGDKLKIKITKDKKSYFEGEITQVLSPSKNRQKPNCEYFEECGGCDILHINYNYQLLLKQTVVKNALNKITKNDTIIVDRPLGMDIPNNYRNKAIFSYSKEKEKIISGFYRKKTKQTIDIQQCNIVHPVINNVKKVVDDFCNNVNFLPKRLAIKYSFDLDELMVCLVIDKKKFNYKTLLIEKLNEFDNIKSIIINYEDKNTVVFGKKSDVIYGNDYITENINGIHFKNYLKSFYQVNPIQTKKLYKKAISLLNITNEDTILDVYCGVGTISLMCSSKAKKVIGVEIVEDAIISAKENAVTNNLNNCQFIQGDAKNLLHLTNLDKINNIKVIVDPPRKGLDKDVIHSILSLNPTSIVYISCNEGTMARDIKLFNENGFICHNILPVDMFCGSHHIENVLKLEKYKID